MTAPAKPTAEQLNNLRYAFDLAGENAEPLAVNMRALLDDYEARGVELERLRQTLKHLAASLTDASNSAAKMEAAAAPGSVDKAFYVGCKVELRDAATLVMWVLSAPAPATNEVKP